MAVRKIVMPQGGQDLEVGTVREWLKQVGRPRQEGRADRARRDREDLPRCGIPGDGFLRQILPGAGTEAAIFAVIGIVADEDEPLP